MSIDIRNDVLTPQTRYRVKGTSMVPTLLSGDEVIVSQVLPEDLTPGDFVFIVTGKTPYVHRFLRRTKTGIVTKGDGRRVPDPIWQATAIRGRVDEIWRKDQRIYRRTPLAVLWNRFLAYTHRITGFIWTHLRRMKTWLTGLFMFFIIPTIVLSSVTLAYFEVDPGEQAIFIFWETASEVGNLGFYLWRSEEQDTGFYKLPISDPSFHFIPSADEGAGAFYDYVDEEITPGVLYYYKVQDVPDNGAEGTYSETLSGGIDVITDTATPTLTPSLTPSLTTTPQPLNPMIRFWTDKEEINAGECTTLQWQTSNVKSVFLDGEGESGVGAKTFCPCENESHILAVYFRDDTRQDFTITLAVTGTCEAGTIVPTATETPIVTEPPAIEEEIKTPLLTRGTTSELQPTATSTRLTSIKPSLTPSLVAPAETRETQTPIIDRINDTPTPTRAIVVGQTHPQAMPSRSIGLLILATLAGFVLIGIGIWLWRSR
jgi:signal peptidase I